MIIMRGTITMTGIATVTMNQHQHRHDHHHDNDDDHHDHRHSDRDHGVLTASVLLRVFSVPQHGRARAGRPRRESVLAVAPAGDGTRTAHISRHLPSAFRSDRCPTNERRLIATTVRRLKRHSSRHCDGRAISFLIGYTNVNSSLSGGACRDQDR
jgi:hypothetical protein